MRRRTRARTGHAGTLDPFAAGLLVLLSGAATKLASCFVGLEKRYVTDVDLTATTTTGDPEGDVVTRAAPPSHHELEGRLARLRGEIELPVPAASAVKIGGERAYKLARRALELFGTIDDPHASAPPAEARVPWPMRASACSGGMTRSGSASSTRNGPTSVRRSVAQCPPSASAIARM